MHAGADAAFGRRIVAALVDFVVLFILLLVVGALLGDSESSGASVSVSLEGASALVFFLIVFLYYLVFESTSGQTPGKKLLGVRVVGADGTKPGVGGVALRTILRVVDGLVFYLVGLVVALLTGDRRQRLGDLAGKTQVIRA